MKLIRNKHTKKIHIGNWNGAGITKCNQTLKNFEYVTVLEFPYIDYQEVGRDGEMYCKHCGTIAEFANAQTPMSVDPYTAKRY